MFIDSGGNIYFGDMRPGDRGATTEEATAYAETERVTLVNSKLAQVRAVREAMLNRMTGIALIAQLNGDTVTVDGFKAARQSLLDITTGHPPDPAQVDTFIVEKYAAIRAALPDTLIKAFAGVDV